MENDREYFEEARRFLKHMQVLSVVPQIEKQKAIASAVVTLGDAAAMCGLGAWELWVNYVRLGTLRMYDGNVPATDFIKVTHLLQDVIAFFCEQERIRRHYHSSYQELVKDILEYGSRSDDNAKQAMLSLSFYFNMSQTEAITFESMIVILSRYFKFYPTGGAESLQVNINNTNSVNNEINIDCNGLVQVVKDWVAAMSPSPSAGQESHAADDDNTYHSECMSANDAEKYAAAWRTEAGKRKGAEYKACLLAALKWEGLGHVAAHKAIHPVQASDESRKAYVNKARHIAQRIADASGGNLKMPSWNIQKTE